MNQIIRFESILNAKEGLIIHGCNMQGKMNSGVAKVIRDKYPDNFETYSKEYANGLHLGQVVIHNVHEDLSICNAITQMWYGKDGRQYVSYEAVQTAMQEIARLASRCRMQVHYPMIGAGLGGGNWAIIQSIIDSVFDIHPAVKRTLWLSDDYVSENPQRFAFP